MYQGRVSNKQYFVKRLSKSVSQQKSMTSNNIKNVTIDITQPSQNNQSESEQLTPLFEREHVEPTINLLNYKSFRVSPSPYNDKLEQNY